MSTSIGQEFIRKTCFPFLPVPPQETGTPQPPLELPYPEGAQLLNLPDPSEVHLPAIDLRTAIERRITVRSYRRQELSQDELSYLLWLTQGVRRTSSRPSTLRNVPSAGARHAFETWLLINQVKGLAPGLYRYAALKHALLALDHSPDINQRMTQACRNQQQIGNSAVTFIWGAVLERMYWRYPERGYRYLFLDAGHVCQNLYLAAEAIDCGVCAIGSFDDALVNGILGMDGDNQFAVYIASLGKRLEKE